MISKPKYYTFADKPGDELLLDCGRSLAPVTLAYETYGCLDDKKSNAILILHALSGDAHAAGRHHPDDRKPGWWDNTIGPGKAFDTNKYFVICSNIIGGCKGSTGPASANPATGKPYGTSFPMITIRDMVRAQKRLIDHLGIEKLLAVAGGSMGGMQVLEWAICYPDSIRAAIPLATTARLSAQSIAFNEVGRQAIVSDPNWHGGDYYDKKQPTDGLALARMIAHITYLSDESMHKKFGRRLQNRDNYSYDFITDFQVESYLHHQGESFIKRFDANSYLYITRAMDYFDLSAEKGSLKKALEGVKARFLVVSFSSDWLFPTYQSKDIASALRKNDVDVSFCEIASSYGHDAFLLEVEQLSPLVSGFLDSTYKGAFS
ncbi:MAG: homoserine O-acetyltransferase [bacterium]|mgnify:CR=1 FL=1|jgi:homoserine O-acetyltransferase|nr:homoserine O-acetyltransferase [bacterium]MDD3804845.1 homoserine O-acetyltransferase [bacterium]MDD4558163.1 homoserine O-acetyltransferase [bacterium]